MKIFRVVLYSWGGWVSGGSNDCVGGQVTIDNSYCDGEINSFFRLYTNLMQIKMMVRVILKIIQICVLQTP